MAKLLHPAHEATEFETLRAAGIAMQKAFMEWEGGNAPYFNIKRRNAKWRVAAFDEKTHLGGYL